MKRSQPRKQEGTRAVHGRIDPASDAAQDAGEGAASTRAPRKRNAYPPEVNTPEAHVEFLRSVANIINERADEVERHLAKRTPK